MEINTIVIIMICIALGAGLFIVWWNLFRKKKKLPFEFKALVFVPSVDSMQLQMQVECVLYRDPKDQLLYIVDSLTKGNKFKEIFPGENKKIFSQDELPKLKLELEAQESKLKTKNAKGTENILNIKKEISRLKYLINKINEPKGTFIIQSSQGLKTIYFLRKSTGNEALHFDIHSNTVFSPNEKNSRDLFNSWKTKYENLKKDEKPQFEKVTLAIAVVVLAVILIVIGILAWKWLNYDLTYAQSIRQQTWICQEAANSAMVDIIDLNKNTSKTLNQFATEVLTGKYGIETPATDVIK